MRLSALLISQVAAGISMKTHVVDFLNEIIFT